MKLRAGHQLVCDSLTLVHSFSACKHGTNACERLTVPRCANCSRVQQFADTASHVPHHLTEVLGRKMHNS